MVFGDAALRDMARRRPSSLDGFLSVRGVGEKKRADYGEQFVQCITKHCHEHQLPIDIRPPMQPPPKQTETRRKTGPNESEVRAFALFRKGCGINEVAERMGRAVSTTRGYFTRFLEFEQICDRPHTGQTGR